MGERGQRSTRGARVASSPKTIISLKDFNASIPSSLLTFSMEDLKIRMSWNANRKPGGSQTTLPTPPQSRTPTASSQSPLPCSAPSASQFPCPPTPLSLPASPQLPHASRTRSKRKRSSPTSNAESSEPAPKQQPREPQGLTEKKRGNWLKNAAKEDLESLGMTGHDADGHDGMRKEDRVHLREAQMYGAELAHRQMEVMTRIYVRFNKSDAKRRRTPRSLAPHKKTSRSRYASLPTLSSYVRSSWPSSSNSGERASPRARGPVPAELWHDPSSVAEGEEAWPYIDWPCEICEEEGTVLLRYFPGIVPQDIVKHASDVLRALRACLGKFKMKETDVRKNKEGGEGAALYLASAKYGDGQKDPDPQPSRSAVQPVENHALFHRFLQRLSLLTAFQHGISCVSQPGLVNLFDEVIVPTLPPQCSQYFQHNSDPLALCTARAFLFDAITQLHLDPNDMRAFRGMLTALGSFEGGVVKLPDLRVRVRLEPSDVLEQMSWALAHEIADWSGVDRLVEVNYTPERVGQWCLKQLKRAGL